MKKDDALAEEIARKENKALGIAEVRGVTPEQKRRNDIINLPETNPIKIAGNQAIDSLMDLVHGIGQPALEYDPYSTMGEMSREAGAARKGRYEERMQQSPIATTMGNIGGGLLASTPIAGISPATQGLPLLQRLAANAGMSAPYGAATYVNPGESRLLNTAVSTGLGTAAPEALGILGKVAAKITNASRGKVPKEAAAIIETGKKHGVPVLAADVAGTASPIQKATEFAEKTPIVNVTDVRLKQQAAAKKAAAELTEKYKQEMLSAKFLGNKGIENIKKVANNPGPRQNAAKDLLKQISNAGDDWQHILKTSGNAKLLAAKVRSDYLYNNVTNIAKTKGNVNFNNTASSFKKQINDLSDLPNINKKTIKELNLFVDDLVDNKGNIKQLNFEQLRKVRSSLSKKINEYYKGTNANIGEEGAQILQQVKNSLDKDLEHFATTNGQELNAAWRKADSFYKERLIPFKDRMLAKALKDESNPDEIYGMFIKSGGEEGGKGTGRAVKFFNALDEKGQAAVRYGMVKNAYNHALDETGSFSPAKFATSLENLASSRGAFFKGAAKHEVDGFVKLMRHIERAGQMKTPETGAKLIGAILGLVATGGAGVAAVTGHTQAVAATGAAAQGIKFLLTSPKARSMLLAASKLAPDSPNWAKITAWAYSLLRKAEPAVTHAVGKDYEKNINRSNKEGQK